MTDVIVKQLSPVSRNTQLSNHDWQALMRIARANDMLGTLAWHIGADQNYEAPEYITRAFQSALVYQAKQRHQVEQECIGMHQLLTQHGINPVFLKGHPTLSILTQTRLDGQCQIWIFWCTSMS